MQAILFIKKLSSHKDKSKNLLKYRLSAFSVIDGMKEPPGFTTRNKSNCHGFLSGATALRSLNYMSGLLLNCQITAPWGFCHHLLDQQSAFTVLIGPVSCLFLFLLPFAIECTTSPHGHVAKQVYIDIDYWGLSAACCICLFYRFIDAGFRIVLTIVYSMLVLNSSQ